MRVLVFLLLLFSLNSYGQGIVRYLDNNEIKAAFSSYGELFTNGMGANGTGFVAPRNTSKSAHSIGNLWLSGIDDGGQLRLASNTYRQSGSDFFAGPIANNYAPIILPGVYDSTYFFTYNNVWEVDEALIYNHQQNYNNANYITPYVIENWPANEDTILGIRKPLAPYFDYNNDGYYNPDDGDYPKVLGDKSLFFMFNDQREPHTESGGLALGVEVHGLAYSFDLSSNPDLNNTIFVNYEIHNKSSINYSDFRLATWFDLCSGCFLDNASGCDTSLNSFFTYNLSAFDTLGSSLRCYNENPPAVGVTFLNKEIQSYMMYENTADSLLGNPQLESHYLNYMSGKKKNGSLANADCDLYGNNAPSNFNYYDDPNLANGLSSIECNNNGLFLHMFPRHIAGIGPFELKSGEKICFDLAFTFAQDLSSVNSHLKSVTQLKQRIQNIQNFYNQGTIGCSALSTSILDKKSQHNSFELFPNPSENVFTIQLKNIKQNAKVEVYDLTGKVIYEDNFAEQININTANWNQSVYLVQIVQNNNVYTKRLVKM